MTISRDLNPIYLQARQAVEELLDRHGFRLEAESSYPASFGSAHAEYRHRAHWVHLNWDGKDGHLWLSGAISKDQHTHPGQAAWRPLDPPLPSNRPATFLEPGRPAEMRIRELVSQLEAFVDAKQTV